MAMAPYKIRIIARACITRYDAGEGAMLDIVDSYNLTEDDRQLVIAQIEEWRSDAMGGEKSE